MLPPFCSPSPIAGGCCWNEPEDMAGEALPMDAPPDMLPLLWYAFELEAEPMLSTRARLPALERVANGLS